MSAPGGGNQFTHDAVRMETRLLIRSVCNSCGASKLVSTHDNSLHEWEDQHQCGEPTSLA